jgi:hypothetical protein
MFNHTDMGIEVGQPKAPLRRHIKGIDGLAKERLDLGPEAVRIVIRYVSGRRIAQHLVDPDLLKFMKQGIQLPWVQRITELPDEIRGAYERCLCVGLRMIVIIRRREARQLDVARQAEKTLTG